MRRRPIGLGGGDGWDFAEGDFTAFSDHMNVCFWFGLSLEMPATYRLNGVVGPRGMYEDSEWGSDA